jgi:hypothetical protein
MVWNLLASITQLFAHFHEVKDDIRLFAEAREEEDAMKIDISDMRNYYDTLSRNI